MGGRRGYYIVYISLQQTPMTMSMTATSQKGMRYLGEPGERVVEMRRGHTHCQHSSFLHSSAELYQTLCCAACACATASKQASSSERVSMALMEGTVGDLVWGRLFWGQAAAAERLRVQCLVVGVWWGGGG